MAKFMDKIKISAGKQQEPTEIERLQQNMAQMETEIQQEFIRLGSMFYRDNLSNDQLEENYRDIIERVKKLDQNRKGFYAHKLRLEGNMMCVNCGEIIPYGSVYCSKCGKRADEKEA